MLLKFLHLQWFPISVALFVGIAVGWMTKPTTEIETATLGHNYTGNDTKPIYVQPYADIDDITTDTPLLEELLDRLARRDEEIEALRFALDNAKRKNEDLAGEVEQLNSEWLFSYGSTRDAGKFVGALIRDGMAIRQMDRDDPARAALAASVFIKLSSMGPIIKEMQNLENHPSEFAEFRASILAEAIGLDSFTQQRVQNVIEDYKSQALHFESGSDSRTSLNAEATIMIRNALSPDQLDQIDSLTRSNFSLFRDPLETPSINPQEWRRGR